MSVVNQLLTRYQRERLRSCDLIERDPRDARLELAAARAAERMSLLYRTLLRPKYWAEAGVTQATARQIVIMIERMAFRHGFLQR